MMKRASTILSIVVVAIVLWFVLRTPKNPTKASMISGERQKRVSVLMSDENGDLCKSPYSNFNLPVGVILPFAGDSVPDGFLPCDGSAIPSGELYEELRKVVGRTYSSDNNERVPDFRGRVPKGFTSGDDRVYDGVETVKLQPNQIPRHRHDLRYRNQLHPNKREIPTFGVGDESYDFTRNKGASDSDSSYYMAPSVSKDLTDESTILTLNENTGEPVVLGDNMSDKHNNIQQTTTANYIIKY